MHPLLEGFFETHLQKTNTSVLLVDSPPHDFHNLTFSSFLLTCFNAMSAILTVSAQNFMQ